MAEEWVNARRDDEHSESVGSVKDGYPAGGGLPQRSWHFRPSGAQIHKLAGRDFDEGLKAFEVSVDRTIV